MRSFSSNVVIGIISNLIFALISYIVEPYFEWNIQIPLWACFTIMAGLVLLIWIFYYGIRQYRIHKAIKTYNYGTFGNSYLYKWDYVKNPSGIYGYEPINIQIAESRTEPNDSNTLVFTRTHPVKEQKIKIFIRLTLMWMVEKSQKERLQPVIEYLHWTEQK